MGLINKDKRIISYECTDLINKLQEDIVKFGENTTIAARCKEYEGVIIYTDYSFLDKTQLTQHLSPDEDIKRMPMNVLLSLLKMQNKVV